VPDDLLDGLEPDGEKMGGPQRNAGADIWRWSRHGSVVLWSVKEKRKKLRQQQQVAVQTKRQKTKFIDLT
jgi:hypothetical protein